MLLRSDRQFGICCATWIPHDAADRNAAIVSGYFPGCFLEAAGNCIVLRCGSDQPGCDRNSWRSRVLSESPEAGDGNPDRTWRDPPGHCSFGYRIWCTPDLLWAAGRDAYLNKRRSPIRAGPSRHAHRHRSDEPCSLLDCRSAASDNGAARDAWPSVTSCEIRTVVGPATGIMQMIRTVRRQTLETGWLRHAIDRVWNLA